MKQVLFLIVTLVSSVYFCCSKQLCRCVMQTLTGQTLTEAGWGGGAATPQSLAKVDLLPIDNNS